MQPADRLDTDLGPGAMQTAHENPLVGLAQNKAQTNPGIGPRSLFDVISLRPKASHQEALEVPLRKASQARDARIGLERRSAPELPRQDEGRENEHRRRYPRHSGSESRQRCPHIGRLASAGGSRKDNCARRSRARECTTESETERDFLQGVWSAGHLSGAGAKFRPAGPGLRAAIGRHSGSTGAETPATAV